MLKSLVHFSNLIKNKQFYVAVSNLPTTPNTAFIK